VRHDDRRLETAAPASSATRATGSGRQEPQSEPGADPPHGHKLPTPQHIPQPPPARAGGALGLSLPDRRNLCLGSVARCLRRVLGLLGGIQPDPQRVGAILGPLRPTLGGLGPGTLGAAIRVRGIGPALGGPPIGLGCLGPGFRPIRAITLRISPFLRLIRPLPLKIGHPLRPGGPLALVLQGRVHGIMTRRLPGRLFGRTRARLHVRVFRHQDQRPAIVAGLGPPAETAHPQAHSLSGQAKSLAGLGVGQPVRHAVSDPLFSRLIGWSYGRSWSIPVYARPA
jgi:hypothetical protein